MKILQIILRTMVKIFCVLALVSCIASHFGSAIPLANTPKAIAEITFTNNGVNSTFTDDQPSLNFQSVGQVCDAGVWITYTGENYSYGEGFGVIEIFPEMGPSCRKPYYGRIGSSRHAGKSDDYESPSVTLYGETVLQGEYAGFLAGDGVASLNFPVSSLVTISSHVELFQGENYEGESQCLELTSCSGEVCWVFKFDDVDLPWDVSLAKSAKAGCLPSSKVHQFKQTGSDGPQTVAIKN